MKPEKLSVSGYKSIRNLENFELTNLNVLIGANGAGKSNFISLFRLLAAIADENLQIYVQKQGGPDALLFRSWKQTLAIKADLEFGSEAYGFELEPTQDNRLIFSAEYVRFGSTQEPQSLYDEESGYEETRLRRGGFAPDGGRSILQSLQSWRVYHFHDTSEAAAVKRVHPSNDNLRLKPDAANIAAYTAMLKREYASAYSSIVSTIRLTAPFFENFHIRDPLPRHVELEWSERGDPSTPHRAHVLSDGTLRFICLATLLLQPEHLLPDTVIIDEPELGLHPYAINLLAAMLKQVASTKQVIIATQSVELLNNFEPEDVVVVDRVDGASTFQRLEHNELSDWLEDDSIGELWKKNIFGGRPTRETVAA